MKVTTTKHKSGGGCKNITNIDRNLRPDKDIRVNDRLDISVKNDHDLHGAGNKRDSKTGRWLPRYGDKNVRDDSIQYNRARYKNNPMRKSLFCSPTHPQ